MTPEAIIALLTLIGTFLGLAAGFYTIKRGISESSATLEHRLTTVETDIKWIKRHIPKRFDDRLEAE